MKEIELLTDTIEVAQKEIRKSTETAGRRTPDSFPVIPLRFLIVPVQRFSSVNAIVINGPIVRSLLRTEQTKTLSALTPSSA